MKTRTGVLNLNSRYGYPHIESLDTCYEAGTSPHFYRYDVVEVMKECNILPDGYQNSPPQEIGKAMANEHTEFKFENAADDVEEKDQELTDLECFKFPNGQVIFKSGNLLPQWLSVSLHLKELTRKEMDT